MSVFLKSVPGTENKAPTCDVSFAKALEHAEGTTCPHQSRWPAMAFDALLLLLYVSPLVGKGVQSLL